MQWWRRFLAGKDSGNGGTDAGDSGQEPQEGSCPPAGAGGGGSDDEQLFEYDDAQADKPKLNLGGLLAKLFINSKVTLLLIIATLLFGVFALLVTPREENPQITVPAVNVIVPFPGASPGEVEKLVTQPLERLIWDINGIEHVMSMAFPDFGVVTAQFEVGEDQETSVFKVYETVYSNLDAAPEGIMDPLVKPIDVNDVPIMVFTLFSEKRSSYDLRQQANRIMDDLRQVEGTNVSMVVGGEERQITVAIDPVKAATYAVDPMLIAEALGGANLRLPTDNLEHNGTRILLRSGQWLRNAEDVRNVVIKTHKFPNGMGGEPIYLRDIASVTDGPGEDTNISRIGFGGQGLAGLPGTIDDPALDVAGRTFNAVNLAIAKKKGTNSVDIAAAILERMETVAPLYLEPDTHWVTTRNDGVTANDTVNELIYNLSWAIVIVIGILVVFLGLRASLIVAVSIPITMLSTLGIGLLAGQTINRITLFALILSLGILIDQTIVVVENIYRHLGMKCGKCSIGETIHTCVIAVNEIATPTIYATLVVVVSMIPMAYVTGMMGPYMGPIPFNVPIAMIISLLVAFKIAPYLSVRWLKVKPRSGDGSDDDTQGASPAMVRYFRRLMTPYMESSARRNMLFIVLVLILLVTFSFPMFKWVKFRMLPKADSKTFLVQLDLPGDATLNHTAGLAAEVEARLLEEPNVINVITTVGTGSVIDFNGLLRGTSFRNFPYQADIRVNLTHKKERAEKSETIVYRLRPELKELADKYDAVVKLVEDPPGPPVRSTLVAEIYGPYGQLQRDLVAKVRGWFNETYDVVDIDDSVTRVPEEYVVRVDSEKAVAAGLKVADVTMSLRAAMSGYPVTMLHDEAEYTQTPIVMRFPVDYRSHPEDLRHIVLPSPMGPVPLSTLVDIERREAQRPIYHKDLKPVSYVYGEMAKRSSVYANIDMLLKQSKDPLPPAYKLVWEGEWDLTLTVFRDLGIAMGVAILLIYLLLVGRFKSFIDPLVLMGAVPLTMLGILPGFAIVGAWNIFFSATGMIGVIALSGIVVRNSIILIEFIQDSMAAGMSLKEATIYAGAIRTRPIVLTAVTAAAGMLMMITDPVWSGLAWALLFGIAASTPLSLVVIPLLYYAVKRSQYEVG